MKMRQIYHEPTVVIMRNEGLGCACIVAGLRDSMWQDMAAAFHFIPYNASRQIELPKSLLNGSDMLISLRTL